jgi:hypothetical protein
MTTATTTPAAAYNMAMAFGYPVTLSKEATANRDFSLAAALDKKGDEYFAAGNDAMGKVCRARALAAANRAIA